MLILTAMMLILPDGMMPLNCMNKTCYILRKIVKSCSLLRKIQKTCYFDMPLAGAIVIGSQTWKIKNVSDNISGSKVYDDNEDNRVIYGGLYTWAMIPDIEALYPGWRVPTLTDWNTLIDYLGGSSVAGGKLKEAGTEHWEGPNTGATNEAGFSALPGGMYQSSYFEKGVNGFFWTNTEGESWEAQRVLLTNLYADVSIAAYLKTYYMSIRLIKT
jgi:uncharacterized protein (TIGR02145 family)